MVHEYIVLNLFRLYDINLTNGGTSRKNRKFILAK